MNTVRDLRIRLRERRGYVREAQGYSAWSEFQVVDGRKVIGRYETLMAAESDYPSAVPTPELAMLLRAGKVQR